MNYLKNYIHVWKNIMKFDGRASRTELWSFWIINLVILAVGYLIGGEILVGVLNIVFALATISVSIRRLHDTNKSGLWWLLGYIPLVGIIVLVFYLQPSDAGRNNYGKLINDGYYY